MPAEAETLLERVKTSIPKKKRDAKIGQDGRIIPVEREGDKLYIVRLEKFWNFLQKSQKDQKREVVLYGGGRSGKSYSIRQWLIDGSCRHSDTGLLDLVVMKTRASLKNAAWDPMIEMLQSYSIPFDQHQTYLDIHIGKSLIQFRGLDDPEKLKSTEYNRIWIEEATRLDFEDYLQLKVRMSRQGPVPNQMILSFNPIDIFHWCMTRVVERSKWDKTVCVMQSNYKNNRFLDQAYIDSLEALKDANYNSWLIYAKGEAGHLEHLIYRNWDVMDMIATPLRVKENIATPDCYGLDWGFNNEMALVAFWLHDDEDYIQEKLYRRLMTLDDLAAWMETGGIARGVEIFADPSNPEAIENLGRRGWNVVPVPSNCRDVKAGIDYCKGRKLHVIWGSDNIIKEIQSYSYKTKKDRSGGEEHVIDEPVKFNDHLMDAMRYARYALKMSSGQPFSGDSIEMQMEESLWAKKQRDPMFL